MAYVTETAGTFALCDQVDISSYIRGVRIIISTSVFGLWSHPFIRVINPMKLDQSHFMGGCKENSIVWHYLRKSERPLQNGNVGRNVQSNPETSWVCSCYLQWNEGVSLQYGGIKRAQPFGLDSFKFGLWLYSGLAL